MLFYFTNENIKYRLQFKTLPKGISFTDIFKVRVLNGQVEMIQ